MGVDQIKDKLRAEFAGEITTESQVLYVMAQMVKLMDHQGITGYRTIRLYRNWTAHISIDQLSIAHEIVKDFDAYITSNNVSASVRLKKLVKPESLKKEMTAFLQSQDINFDHYRDRTRWKRFVKHLAHVIEQTPLQVSVHKSLDEQKTNFVSSVTVQRSRNEDKRAMLTWTAHCHKPLPQGVENEIKVVLLEQFDDVKLPAPKGKQQVVGSPSVVS